MPNRLSYIKLLLAIALWAIGGICTGCKEYDDLSTQTPAVTPNISIRQLRELVADKVVTIDQELIIGGYVTSCDKDGNFYRSFTFEDISAGAELMAGLYDLHNIYPQGYRVTVNLQGCSVAIYNGILQIGREAKSYSNYPTDYFYTRLLLDKYVTTHDTYQPVTPSLLTIDTLNEELCGKLVSINNLRLCSRDYLDTWRVNTDGKWSGYNLFCDASGNTVVVLTSEYASYAQNYIPTDTVILTGILQHSDFGGEKHFFIKMRNEKDCVIHH
jgi:hypothetical protein